MMTELFTILASADPLDHVLPHELFHIGSLPITNQMMMAVVAVEVIRPALKEHTDRFVPFLWTLFFFILFCNLLGQIPVGEIITALTGRESHISGTATGTLTTTAALA